MGLNVAKGQMYEWITHTWNTVKGECPHDCSYCYMKRWGKLKPVRFDKKELKTDLGNGNFIFVGSSCDMFAKSIPEEWIKEILGYCNKFNNEYLFQTKNPEMVYDMIDFLPLQSVICTTIETNRWYPEIMQNSPLPIDRALWMNTISLTGRNTYLTIEPIIDFDVEPLIGMVKYVNPKQVNIGFNTSFKIKLPEPSKEKVLQLIAELEKFTVVHKKSNLIGF